MKSFLGKSPGNLFLVSAIRHKRQEKLGVVVIDTWNMLFLLEANPLYKETDGKVPIFNPCPLLLSVLSLFRWLQHI